MLFRQQNVQRLIEIGPSDTLVSMAKKTLAGKQHVARDAAMSLSRELLCYKKDQQQIRYEDEAALCRAKESEAEEEAKDEKEKMDSEPERAVSAPTKPQPASVNKPAIPDRPATAADIVTTVVAHKTNKAFHHVPRDQSIKHIVGGLHALFFCHSIHHHHLHHHDCFTITEYRR